MHTMTYMTTSLQTDPQLVRFVCDEISATELLWAENI